MSELGKQVKAYRKILDLSLQDVADRAGLTKAHIWDIEQGRSTNPTMETVCRLAVALKTKPQEFAAYAAADCMKTIKVETIAHQRVTN